MNPVLLAPIGLAALAALAVPLLIHLARRTEERPVDFAALRWLRARPRPRRRPRLDERLLLAVRLVLLALAALLLARPALVEEGARTPVRAIVPGAAVAATPGDLWLAPGFPPAAGPAPAGPLPVGSLVRELDATLPPGTPLAVVVPAVLEGADADRPRLSRPVDWRIVGGAMPAAGTQTRPLDIVLRSDAAHEAGARYLRAAAEALRRGRVDAGSVERPVPEGSRIVLWLAHAAPPAAVLRAVERGGVLLVAHDTAIDAGGGRAVWRDGAGGAIVDERARGRGRVLRLTRPLAPLAVPEVLEATFPAALAGVLEPPVPAPARAAAVDYRPMPGGPRPAPPARDLTPWLVMAVAVVWLAERALATLRRRGVAA